VIAATSSRRAWHRLGVAGRAVDNEESLLAELGEGWTKSGDGVYYPPGVTPPDQLVAGVERVTDPADLANLHHRRAELVRIYERTAERAAAFPNPVIEGQARKLRDAIDDIDRRL
jgi:hypothetical protein